VILPSVEPRYAGFWRRLGAGVTDLDPVEALRVE